MQSTAQEVDQYMKEIPADRVVALEKLRTLLLDLPGLEESMEYGMPTYAKDGKPFIAWASQKQYISLYLPPIVLRKWEDKVAGPGVSNGKSCLRFTRTDRINFDQVEEMLQESIQLDEMHA